MLRSSFELNSTDSVLTAYERNLEDSVLDQFFNDKFFTKSWLRGGILLL